ncbi:DUF560 domain-containing protein [Pusillimonas sp. ANT_WB101]|nr:DUF560 domain-containing protein [Pusillimonas sp. ANT_WB101]
MMLLEQGLASASPCLLRSILLCFAAISNRVLSARHLFSAYSGLMKNVYLPSLFLAGALGAVPVFAQSVDDTRQLLRQRTEQQTVERGLQDNSFVKPVPQPPASQVDNQPQSAEQSTSELGQALYLSLQHRQWMTARSLLAQYLTLSDRDPLLVYYTQGLLARADGKLGQAEDQFRALLALQPTFLPARLELARVLFESAQDREAYQSFSDIDAFLGTAGAGAAGIRRTVATYLDALERRKAWRTSISMGMRWSDNVNRTSASRTCLVPASRGLCLIERALPEPIKAFGPEFASSTQRRFPLAGHHGLYVRAQTDGSWYRNHRDYNEASVAAEAGYSYRNANHQFTIAPTYSHYIWGKNSFYDSWGLNTGWRYTPSPHSLVTLEADYKNMQYRQQAYARYFNGPNRSVSATYYRDMEAGWTLFGGFDAEDSRAKASVQSYLQQGVRLGASLQTHGFTGTALATLRQRSYRAYNPLLEARRRDHEQSYSLVLSSARWSVAGFVPSLTLRHNKVRSNVGWLYSYDRNVVAVTMEYVI